MGKSTKTSDEKAPRRKWHERIAEKDIRYRGPLNYQHFQILGWLCIVASQALLILSLSEKMGKLPAAYAGLMKPLTYISWLSLPFLLIANFAQIMNGQKSYRFLLIKNFCAAGAIWGIYAFFLNRYVIGTIDMINDGTITSLEALCQIMEKAAPTGVLCFNIFVDLFLCTLVMFFLNYKPTRIFKEKTRFIFRSFALHCTEGHGFPERDHCLAFLLSALHGKTHDDLCAVHCTGPVHQNPGTAFPPSRKNA